MKVKLFVVTVAAIVAMLFRGGGSVAQVQATNPYITLSGQSFVQAGQIIHPYGSTMYPIGSGWQKSSFPHYIDSIISEAQKAHINTLRPTNFLDNVPYADWYNETVWSNMDYLFRATKAHHMYVLLDLSSFRDKALKQGINPYSNTLLLDQQFAWAAKRYAHQTNLLNYAIAGEVKCPTSSDPLRPLSTETLTQFYRQLSTVLYLNDPNHLVSTGGLSYLNEKGCGIDWQTIDSLPHIHITAIHVYSTQDQTITIPMVSSWAAAHHKPFTIEEFGWKQGIGDGQRALDFQHIYDLCRKYHATTVVFWNLANLLGPTHYDVWENTPLTWQVVIRNSHQ